MKLPSIRFARAITGNARRIVTGRAATTLLCILVITLGQPGEIALCVPDVPTLKNA